MNKDKYKIDLARMESLLALLTSTGSLSEKDQNELDLVSESVASFEELNHPFKPDNLVEMIELRMYQRKLKQKDLATVLDTTPSRVSEILNGKRGLTLDIAKKLYSKLNIDAELILR